MDRLQAATIQSRGDAKQVVPHAMIRQGKFVKNVFYCLDMETTSVLLINATKRDLLENEQALQFLAWNWLIDTRKLAERLNQSNSTLGKKYPLQSSNTACQSDDGWPSRSSITSVQPEWKYFVPSEHQQDVKS